MLGEVAALREEPGRLVGADGAGGRELNLAHRCVRAGVGVFERGAQCCYKAGRGSTEAGLGEF